MMILHSYFLGKLSCRGDDKKLLDFSLSVNDFMFFPFLPVFSFRSICSMIYDLSKSISASK